MRAVVQRVTRASVSVDGAELAAIERGFLALIGVAVDDVESDADALAHKIAGLRVFDDAQGAMNLALADGGWLYEPAEVSAAIAIASLLCLRREVICPF